MLFLRLRCSPLIVVTSCLDDKQKKTLKSNIHKLGMRILMLLHLSIRHISGIYVPYILVDIVL